MVGVAIAFDLCATDFAGEVFYCAREVSHKYEFNGKENTGQGDCC